MPDLSSLAPILSALLGPYGLVVGLLVLVILMGRVLLDVIKRLLNGDLVPGQMVSELKDAFNSVAEANDKQAAVSDATLRALEQRGPRA